MIRARRWPEVLTLLGGVGLIVTLFEVRNNGRSDYDHLHAILRDLLDYRMLVYDWGPRPAPAGSIFLTLLDILLLRMLPHAFALFCVTRAACALAFGRGARPSRLILRLILIVWGIAHLVAVFHTCREWEDLYPVAYVSVGLLFLGYVASSRLRRPRSPAEAVRRSTALGSELAIVWFVGRLLRESWPDVPLTSREVVFCLLILAGSVLPWPERGDVGPPGPASNIPVP